MMIIIVVVCARNVFINAMGNATQTKRRRSQINNLCGETPCDKYVQWQSDSKRLKRIIIHIYLISNNLLLNLYLYSFMIVTNTLIDSLIKRYICHNHNIEVSWQTTDYRLPMSLPKAFPMFVPPPYVRRYYILKLLVLPQRSKVLKVLELIPTTFLNFIISII